MLPGITLSRAGRPDDGSASHLKPAEQDEFGLPGDELELEFAEWESTLERIFDVEFTDEETEQLLTVGDLHDLLLRKMSPGGEKCASAMSYYRLRRAVMKNFPGKQLSPSFDLSRLDSTSAHVLFKDLERATGLNLPMADLTRIGLIGEAILLPSLAVGFVGAIPAFVYSRIDGPYSDVVWWLWIIAFLGGIVLSVVLARLDPGRIPEDCRTLGGLAKRTAELSYGRLIRLGAARRDEDIWKLLVKTFSDPAADQIFGRGTYLSRRSLEKTNAA
jgi:acyl carrier protein